ncbi:ATP-dependent carboxylate-amine ligase domain protein ATP-grasp [Caldicellulosiruptor owensensis OL]|uniref:ATP-dependent carboxylate-amine ligase domain protein ATP-grasp n=1 Tax=Caldicellulosiruptor owensensis (strain ATCC 700167 / DSM 13100 / OL) TaxID=632518 RepID=E4Q3K8_CALOW|nr:Mur ligase [Caldicellulosiruptor owensensis]ADQ03968.1 ATP-dependent carboxylate-amine ligase domain protein ATP-grasp [Caldicellulosiruptor owensensis OL]
MKIENIKVYNNRNIYSDKKVVVLKVKGKFEEARNFAMLCIHIQNLIGYNLVEYWECLNIGDYIDVLIEHDNQIVVYKVIEFALECMGKGLEPEDFPDKISKLKKLTIETELSPNTRLLKNACMKRGIRFTRIGYTDTFILGEGKYAKLFAGLISEHDFGVVSISNDREMEREFLKLNFFPVAPFEVIFTSDQLTESIKKLGFPISIKGCRKDSPNIGNIRTNQQALEAFNMVKSIENRVIVERYVPGNSYKILVVNGKVVAAVERTSPYIVGDGKRRISELLDQGERNNKYIQKNILKQGFTLDDILPKGMRIFLKEPTSFKTGCITTDVTEKIAYENQQLFVEIAERLGYVITVLDFVTEDISLPYSVVGGYVVDIETNCDLRIFSQTCNSDIFNTILDVYFEKIPNPSVPIIAVAGTYGKSTILQTMRYIFQRCGLAISIDSEIENFYLRSFGDFSDIKLVEFNPEKNIEEIEIEPDVGIITNTFFQDQIEKNLLFARSIKENGYLILNVNDAYKYLYSAKAKCRIVFTSTSSHHPDLKAQMEMKKPCVYLENDIIKIFDGKEMFSFCNIKEIPYSYEGKLMFAIENILQTVAAMYFYGVDSEIIYKFLTEYKNDSHQNPGKFNIFDINGIKVIIDSLSKKNHLKLLVSNLNLIGIKDIYFVCEKRQEQNLDFVKDKNKVICRQIERFSDVIEMISDSIKRAKKGDGVFIILPEPLNKDVTFEIREGLAKRKRNFVNNA